MKARNLILPVMFVLLLGATVCYANAPVEVKTDGSRARNITVTSIDDIEPPVPGQEAAGEQQEQRIASILQAGQQQAEPPAKKHEGQQHDKRPDNAVAHDLEGVHRIQHFPV